MVLTKKVRKEGPSLGLPTFNMREPSKYMIHRYPKIWIDAKGRDHQIRQMDTEYIRACIRFIIKWNRRLLVLSKLTGQPRLTWRSRYINAFEWELEKRGEESEVVRNRRNLSAIFGDRDV